MTDTVHTAPGHPPRDFALRVHAVLDGISGTPAWSMTTDEQAEALVDLARAQSRIEELRLRVLAAADRGDLSARHAATSTAAWLAHRTRVPASAAHRDVRLAVALDTDLGATRDALAAGVVDADQARVVVDAVTGLPAAAVAAEPDLAGRVEKHLLALAGEHDARALKRLARHVLDVIDPDRADEALGRRLQAEEEAAALARRRLAGEAGVIPAVVRRLVDGRSVVLDLGRSRRLHTEAQRIALTVEQGGCTTEGCTRPAAWCQAHHDVPWSRGGVTSVANGRLLCPHHDKAHHPDYSTTHLPHGKVRFARRT